MRVTLMHNPAAGHGEHSKEALLSALRQAGYDPAYQSMDEDDFPLALRDPGALVVVAGGDGTVDKLAKHLVGRGIPIGLLPLGTANNVARTLGIDAPIEELMAGWDLSRRKPFDVGVMEGTWGTMQFIEAAGFGFFPQVMPTVSAAKKRRKVDSTDDELSYDLRAFRSLLPDVRAHPWNVTLDDRDISGRYLLLEAMNVRSIGPGLCLAPEACPGDGYLDVVLISEEERDAFADYLTRCLDEASPPHPFTVLRGKNLEVEWGGSAVHTDSNIWPREGAAFAQANAAPCKATIQLEAQALDFL